MRVVIGTALGVYLAPELGGIVLDPLNLVLLDNGDGTFRFVEAPRQSELSKKPVFSSTDNTFTRIE